MVGQASEEMVQLLKRVEDENPYNRLSADALLRLPIFDRERAERFVAD